MIIYLFLLCSMIQPSFITTFNLSPKHALVYKDPSGQKGSYFGFSLALQEDNSKKHWLLVGAPRGNSTYSAHTNITEPGVMYQCQLEGAANCTAQLLDSAGNDRNVTLKYEQHKDSAWIGGALDVKNSANKQIVVCGPRWTNYYETKKNRTHINGICYMSDVTSHETNAEKLMPLMNTSESSLYYERKKTDVNLTDELNYYKFFGQAGMSVHFTKDGRELLIGAPGVLTWKGTVIRYNLSDLQHPVIGNVSRASELKEFSYLGYSLDSGNFFNGNKNKKYYVSGAPRAGDKFEGKVFVFDFFTPDDKNSEPRLNIVKELKGEGIGEYFGATVCVVDVNRDGMDDILVGSPHYADKRKWDQGRVSIYLIKDNFTYTTTVLVGSKESGAQFGSAISSLGDIDMDGYNDFAVGAPYEDSGAGVVYIYYGRKSRIKDVVPLRILGREINSAFLGFGISFSRGLDIDGNNYNDFAVGAYKSGYVAVIRSFPVISYKATLTTNVSSIGFSATGFTIKTCLSYTGKYIPEMISSIVTITLDKLFGRVRFRDTNERIKISELQLTKDKERCIDHQVSIEQIRQDYSKKIQLRMEYKPKVDPMKSKEFCKLCPVVNPKKDASVESLLPYTTGCNKDDFCKTDLSVAMDFVNTKYRKEFCKLCPVVNPKKDSSVESLLPYATGCNRDDFCKTDLGVAMDFVNTKYRKEFCKLCSVVNPKKDSSVESLLPYATGCNRDDFCKTDLSVAMDFVNTKYRSPVTIGTQEIVKIKVSVQNTGEPAFLANVKIMMPPECSLVRIPQLCDYDVQTSKQLICQLDNPLIKGTLRTIELDVDLKNVKSGIENLIFIVNATSKGEEQTPENNSAKLELHLVTITDIGIIGSPNLEEIVFYGQNKTDETETTFSHIYEFKNFGPSPLNRVNLEFKIPVSIGEAKNFVEIHEIQAKQDSNSLMCRRSDIDHFGRSVISNLAANITNKGNMDEGDELASSRTTLEVEDITTSQTTLEAKDVMENITDITDVDPEIQRSLLEENEYPSQSVLSIDCKTRHTTCVTVHCTLDSPILNQTRAVVKFNMVAKFEVLEYALGDRNILSFYTSGKATIENPNNVQQAEENRPEQTSVKTTFHGRFKEAKLNFTIVGITIGASILVLLIIMLICWKMGFFKKKDPEQAYRAMIMKKNKVN